MEFPELPEVREPNTSQRHAPQFNAKEPFWWQGELNSGSELTAQPPLGWPRLKGSPHFGRLCSGFSPDQQGEGLS